MNNENIKSKKTKYAKINFFKYTLNALKSIYQIKKKKNTIFNSGNTVLIVEQIVL